MKRMVLAGFIAIAGCATVTAPNGGQSTQAQQQQAYAQRQAQLQAQAVEAQVTTAQQAAAKQAAINPTIPVLRNVVASGQCVRLDKVPPILAQLYDEEYRFQLGSLVAEGGDPNRALTEWLVLAAAYQDICNLHGDPRTEAATYLSESVPLAESTIDAAIASQNCKFLSVVHRNEVWPYEAQMGNEVVQRDFRGAEVTRRLWIQILGEFQSKCSFSMTRRDAIAINATVERLDRIIGLDDSNLIDLRTKMLDALESGNERKVVAFAKAISEREAALDSRNAADYEAKVASIEQTMKTQASQLAAAQAALQAAPTAAVAASANAASANAASANAANSAAEVANTMENVAAAAKATKATVGILKALF